MINVMDPQAERDRQLRLVDATAARIMRSMHAEFNKVATSASRGFRRNLSAGAMEALAGHQERVTAILIKGLDPLIARFAADVMGGNGKKALLGIETKVEEGFGKNPNKTDENEELALLLLLLIGRFSESWNATYIDTTSTQIAETTNRQLTRNVALAVEEMDSLSESMTPNEAQARAATGLRTAILGTMISRADTIGNTSAHTTSQAAILGTAEELDNVSRGQIVNFKQWISRGDSRVRSTSKGDAFGHVQTNGQVKPLGQPFQVPRKNGTTEATMYPGDPSSSAGNSINCRCVMSLTTMPN